MTWILTIILYFLAAALDAVSDSVENEHISATIFATLNPNFWYKRQSWQTAKMIFGYRIDAWHISKSLWLLCLTLGSILYRPITKYWYVDVVILGVTWIASFDLFYNVVFKKK